ncbi:gibberellin biosynthesis-related protein [Vibrio ishigakensis]|uniref:Gibberellin biosynthesis-related protein n=2 Tax=Vibrio ishigakensis TaxID=1481914 RepID=A0A0B8P1W0_9VIBR|nr:gibberellin biosynthesis-related protein [Vibrio ishigakensis]
MDVALYSQCTGANAQFEALSKHPELFENITCMLAPLAVSMEALMGSFAKLQGVEEYLDVMDFEQLKFGGYQNKDMNPQFFADAVKMPLLMTQVLDDIWTDNPSDGQKTFDLISSSEKEMLWIEGTTRRFDGYNYFGENPKQMLDFFEKHL